MEIILQNNMVVVRTDFKTLKSNWMENFLNSHSLDMLFLPKAVLVFSNSSLFSDKEEFLHSLCTYYTKDQEGNNDFYLRSVLRYMKHPIKIELQDQEDSEVIEVRLQARSSSQVHIKLDSPNRWVMSYLKSQLDLYVQQEGLMNLFLELPDNKAKSRLERALNKRHILHYEIHYTYDAYFMQNLYSEFGQFEYEDHTDDEIDEMLHYYTVLECPVGSSQDALKKSYKKLVKIYHPDKVHCENLDTVYHYTQKFQLLQEAYTALRIVS
ncbi:J domain-containing protein [Sulfurimonas sp. MAG313]|nr:J domain-containing protein [Sulfurimonas sp. MAG313]MDF1881795.1 J domain-containing protein [Sulfurimonas sp. MAG313]